MKLLLPTALLAIFVPVTAGASSSVSLATYSARVHSIRLALDRAVSHGSSTAAVAAELRGLRTVRFPDGGQIDTGMSDLAGRLQGASAGQTHQIAAEIDALDSQLRGSAASPFGRSQLRALDSVLADSRFHPAQNPIGLLADWVGARIDDLLRALFQQQPWAGSGLGILQYVVAVLFLAAVVVGAILLARGAVKRSVADLAPFDEIGEPRTSGAAGDGRARALEAGDYRMALRYLFLATLLQLQEEGIIRLQPGTTNWEYVRSVHDLSGTPQKTRAGLEALVELFDRTWYGHLPIDRVGYDRAHELTRDILAAAGSGRAA